MEIKRINGVISAYKTARKGTAQRSESASQTKNTDRVEFGFDTALQAARNGIAAAVRADATPQELSQAQQSMDSVEPPSVAAAVPSPDFHKQTTGGSLKEMLSQREREILQLYQQRYKSTRKIANMLGISQSSVVRKLNLYGLQSEDK